MTKEEALNQIHMLEEYVKSLPPEKTRDRLMEETFIEFMNQGLTLKLNYGDIFYYKGVEWVVCKNSKNKVVWLKYYLFWSVFETKFGCNYKEIKNFLNGMVCKHLGCNGFEIKEFSDYNYCCWSSRMSS